MDIKKILRKTIIGGGYRCLTSMQAPFANARLDIDTKKAFAILQSIREERPVEIECKNSFKPRYDLMIVVPVYNVGNYFNECIISLLNQNTEYSYKVIVIDDGSNDGTERLIDEYLHNSKIKIIHQSNRGIACARNVGIRLLEGKYLMFVDSDDILFPNAIQILLKAAYSKDADIVEGGNNVFKDNGRIIKNTSYKDTKCEQDFKYRGQPWGKVIRSELFENFQFPESYEYEDSIIGACIIPSAQKCYNISEIIYGYRYNTNSITYTSTKKEKCIDTYYLSLYLWDWHANKFGITKNFANQILCQMVLNYKRTMFWGGDILKSGFCLQRDCYIKLFKTRFLFDGKLGLLEKYVYEGNWGGYNLLCKRWEYL